MQTGHSYRTNRDLFSNHYLDEHLPETEDWDAVNDDDLRMAYDEIKELWDREKSTAPKRNESQLEEKFVRPMFRALGIPFEVEESTSRTLRRPDYGFFDSDTAARDAFDRREAGGDFYEKAVAVADAKRWGRSLDTRGSGEHERDFENPSYQIHVYLQETPVRWAVLTDGRTWRLYYAPTSHRLDSYYEIDLSTLLEDGDLEAFKYFYLFFRHEAFLEDAGGDCFLDDVYEESTVFAQELGEDLQNNIYEAIKVLATGYLEYPDNDLDEDDLELIHDSSLIYLYRLIFVLYAESEGRDLLDTNNTVYEQSFSLNALKQEVAAELDSSDPKYRDWQNTLQSRLNGLFALIDRGSKACGIPEAELSVPAYNGGLFRTDPAEDDSREAQFLADHDVGDTSLARVIELLTRSEHTTGDGKTFVDYSSLEVRHLGSIYEGLLEYQLAVAHEPLTIDDEEYAASGRDDDVVVDAGEVYLTTGSGERKATGSYYTPEYVVEYIIDTTVGPVVEDVREDLAGSDSYSEGGFAEEFAQRVFELKILDPAMGSGHFLTSVVDYLAREIIDAQEKQAKQHGFETIDGGRDINWARRKVAQQCIYGVDRNPLATELAKVSLWLRTLAAEQPLAFLDHHLKTGNSLVGSDIEAVLDDDGELERGQLTLQQSFAHTRQQALEHVMGRFQDLLSIDNHTIADAKEMETVYDEVREDPLYQQLLAMANVHTAHQFGLDIPADAHKRMATALRDDSWEDIVDQDWFRSAQSMADDERFFHWELEFPVAYYTSDGSRKSNAGFDAVIGNPPWVATAGRADISANIDTDLRSYLAETFSATETQFDLYVAFYEQSIRHAQSGRVGIIVPDSILTREQNEPIRDFVLRNAVLSEIVRVGTAFKGVETGAVILISSDGGNGIRCADATAVPTLDSLEYTSIPQHVFEKQDAKRFLIYLDEATRSFLSKVERHIALGERIEISRGEELGKRADHLHETPQSTTRPISPGGAVTRYGIDDTELRYIETADIAKAPQQYRSPKLIFRQTSDTLIGTFDDDDLVTIKSAYNLHSKSRSSDELKHILGVLNSSVLEFYHHYKHAAYRSVFPQINQSTFEAFPVAFDGEPDESIVEAVEHRLKYTADRSNINLHIPDYLGNYEAGPPLIDLLESQPVESVSETILTSTTVEWPNLKIGAVNVDSKRGTVTITLTARYKPDEDAAETDRWGYAETDPIPAVEFVGLDDQQKALIESFVPYAAEKGGGFANFRRNATQSKSLLDRLHAMTLPRMSDIEDGLRRYLEKRERATAIDAMIEAADRTIEDRVSTLYGLTDEERELVRSDFRY